MSRADLAGLFVAGSLLGLLLLAAMGEGEAEQFARAQSAALLLTRTPAERQGAGEPLPLESSHAR